MDIEYQRTEFIAKRMYDLRLDKTMIRIIKE
jgi:hypothetical protein